MIQIQGLHCGYGNREVLRSIDLSVDAGVMVGILGPNGSGKSTLIKAISGVLRPARGTVLLDGRPAHTWPARQRARRLACVSQRISFDFPFTCLEAVLMGRYAHTAALKGYSRHDLEKAEAALELVGMDAFRHRPVDSLSGGEMQMVAIARAICQDAPLLLLDEATASLDIARKIAVFDLFKEMQREGRSFVCVMHDLNLAAMYCDLLVVIHAGELAAMGPPADVMDPAVLSGVYGAQVLVAPHPLLGVPQVHFSPSDTVTRGGVSSCS